MKKLTFVLILSFITFLISATQDRSPIHTEAHILNTDSLWDLHLQFDVDTPTGQIGLSGMEWDGTYFYASKWSGSNQLFKFDHDGNYVEPITVPIFGCRDMAYDGTYMYGSPASSSVSCWVSDTGIAVPANNIIVDGVSVRALAYDEVTDTFWSGNWGDNIVNWNRAGTILESYPWPGSLYGLAYDNDPLMGELLYAHSQDPGCMAYQLEINNNLQQLSVMNYTALGAIGAIAGGACAMTDWDPTFRTLGLLLQGSPDYIIVVELDFGLNLEAPGQPVNFLAIPDPTGALETQLSWINPAVNVAGYPLVELDELRIFRNQTLIYVDNIPIIGEPYTYLDSSVPASGLYDYEVQFYNIFGPGIPADETIWVGEDVPAAVEDLVLTTNPPNLIGILTWVNPTTGLHNGAFNEPILGYHIERSDGCLFEIAGIQTQWIDDTIPAPGYYSYSVQPYNSVGDGGIAETTFWPWPEILISEDFSSGSFPPDGWTINNSNNWLLSITNYAGGNVPEADLHWSPSVAGPHYLISYCIDTSDFDFLNLSFSHYLDPYSSTYNYNLYIKTTSNGTDWHIAYQIEHIENIIVYEDIIINTEDVGSENFQVAWVFEGDSWDMNDWFIDDILLIEYYTGNTGFVEGHVEIIGGSGNLEEVLISSYNMFVHPNANGDYSITLPIGNHDLTASLYHYDPVTIDNILVETGVTITGIDFTLNYVDLIPPSNLAVNEMGVFSWYAPQIEREKRYKLYDRNRDLLGYEVYLDDYLVGFTEDTQWQFEELVVGCEYEAGVEAVYDAGNSEMVTIIFPPFTDSEEIIIPLKTEITSIFPNPFNPSTTIKFSIEQNEQYELCVYNMKGQKVKQLVSNSATQLSAGQHSVTWNGTDDTGKKVSSGIYFCRLKCGEVVQTKRMLLLK